MCSITGSYCPVCGSEDLEIRIDPSTAAAGETYGDLFCRNPKCPRPTAAAEILGSRETEHIIVVGEESFSLQHPLRERLDGELFDCRVHRWLKAQDGPPVEPGRYRMIDEGDPAAGYCFEPVED